MCERRRGPVDKFDGDVNRRKRNWSGPIKDHDE